MSPNHHDVQNGGWCIPGSFSLLDLEVYTTPRIQGWSIYLVKNGWCMRVQFLVDPLRYTPPPCFSNGWLSDENVGERWRKRMQDGNVRDSWRRRMQGVDAERRSRAPRLQGLPRGHKSDARSCTGLPRGHGCDARSSLAEVAEAMCPFPALAR